MTTQPTRFNHCCARSGVFVVLFVVDDEDYTNSFILRLQRRLCRSLRHQWQRTIRINSICAFSGVFVVCSVVDDDERYEFIQFAPSAASLLFAPSSMTTNDTIQSCWKPIGSSFCRIAAVGRSTPITINSLTLIVVGSTLVIHRAFALFLSDVLPYASLWVW